MYQIRAFWCIGRGVPELSRQVWFRTTLTEVSRDDPFTGKAIIVPTWVPADAVEPSGAAEVYGFIELATDEVWAPAARALKAQSSGLHDGMLFELWTIIVGEAAAQSAWKPSWITRDGLAQLIEFPVGVSRWLAASVDEARAKSLSQWLQLPYLENAGGPEASMVGQSLLRILTPLARVAVEHEASMVAEVHGYALP